MKNIFIIFFIGSFLILNLDFVFAQIENTGLSTSDQDKKGIEVLNLQTFIREAGRIEGSFVLKNKSNIDLTNLSYYLTLQAKPVFKKVDELTVEMVNQPLIAFHKEGKIFQLEKGINKDFNFSFHYPTTSVPGIYQISLFVQDLLGSQNYAAEAIDLNIEGSNENLIVPLEHCRILRGDQEFVSFVGALFEPGESPQIRCPVTNPNERPVEFSVRHQTNIFHLLNYISAKEDATVSQAPEVFSLNPKETKEINFSLPRKERPNIYESFTQFIDNTSKEAISPYLVFRWTIKGEAARITAVRLIDSMKFLYRKNEKLNLSIDYSPSPDLWWRRIDSNLGTDLTDAKIVLILYGWPNLVCGQLEKEIKQTVQIQQDQQFELRNQNFCQPQKILIQIIKNNQILDEYVLNFPITASIKILQGLFILLPLFLIFLFILILKRREKLSKIKFFSLLILCIFLFVLFLVILFNWILVREAKAASLTLWHGCPVNDRSSNLEMKVSSYQIDPYAQNGLPEKATVDIYYRFSGGLCDNDDPHVTLAFFIDQREVETYSYQTHLADTKLSKSWWGTCRTDLSSRTVTGQGYIGLYRLVINNTGVGISEEGVIRVNLLENERLKEKLKSLTPGNHFIIVDGRVIIQKLGVTKFEPGVTAHCGYPSSSDFYEAACSFWESYYTAWAGELFFGEGGSCSRYCNPLGNKIPFTVLPETTYNVPSFISFSATPTCGTNRYDIALSWQANNANTYDIYRRMNGGTWQKIAGSISGLTYTDPGITVGTAYGYYVTASGPGGKVDSEVKQVKIDETAIMNLKCVTNAVKGQVKEESGDGIDGATVSIANVGSVSSYTKPEEIKTKETRTCKLYFGFRCFQWETTIKTIIISPKIIGYYEIQKVPSFLRHIVTGSKNGYQDGQISVYVPESPVVIADIILKKVANRAPAVSIFCLPSECIGYYGIPRDFPGSLDIIYSANDPDNNISSCKFKIDGSLISSECNKTILVTSYAVGSHIVSIKVTDAGGLSAAKSLTFTIKRQLRADFECSIDNKIFQDCSKIKPRVDDKVYFKDASIPSEGASINSWNWTFSQGQPNKSSGANPNTIFKKDGSNKVTLKVIDTNSKSAEISKTIDVEKKIPEWQEVAPF